MHLLYYCCVASLKFGPDNNHLLNIHCLTKTCNFVHICIARHLGAKGSDIHPDTSVKKSLTRDFRLQVFFHKSVSPRAPGYTMEPFRILTKIRGDIRKLRLITSVNDTGDNILLVAMTLVNTDNHKVANISANFRKKFDMSPIRYSGARGKLNREKT